MDHPPSHDTARQLGRWLLALFGAACLTMLCFLVLPLIQALGQQASADTLLRPADVAALPPPPPPPEPEKPPEPEPDPEPPRLQEELPPLDLAQLELVLNPGTGGSWWNGVVAGQQLQAHGAVAGDDNLFSLADLDQKPRAIYQPSPVLDATAVRRTPGRVYVLFMVDEDGRVIDPVVQSATDPALEAPAVTAIRKWKFEPGMRNGQAVRFRMRAPIVFPAQ